MNHHSEYHHPLYPEGYLLEGKVVETLATGAELTPEAFAQGMLIYA